MEHACGQDKRLIHYYDSVLIIIFYGAKKALSQLSSRSPAFGLHCISFATMPHRFPKTISTHLHVCHVVVVHYGLAGIFVSNITQQKWPANSSPFYSSKKVIILSDPIRLAFVLLPHGFIRHSRCDNFVFFFFLSFRWFVFRRVVLLLFLK